MNRTPVRNTGGMVDVDEARRAAIRRIKAKRWFLMHVGVFVVVNVLLVLVWAGAGAGYFWPGWVMFGWGIGLAAHGLAVYGGSRPISEEQIRRELDRDRGLGT